MNWYDEEEERKKREQQNNTISVQNQWDKEAAIANNLGFGVPDSSNDNYLLSAQKVQHDEAVRQRDEAERAAKAAAVASAPRYVQPEIVEEVVQPAQRPVQNNALKYDPNGWKKYYNQQLDKERGSLTFFEKLLDNGAASRRAEIHARNRYNNELMDRQFDAGAQNVSPELRRSVDQNMNLARLNSAQNAAIYNSIGLTPATKAPTFIDDPVGSLTRNAINLANLLRHSNIYNPLGGIDDTHKFGLDDVLRGGTKLISSIPESLITTPKAAVEAITGQGTDYETGLEKKLSPTERIGRGIESAVDLVSLALPGGGGVLSSAALSQLKKPVTDALVKQAIKTGDKELLTKTLTGVGVDQAEQAAERLIPKVAKGAGTQAGLGAASGAASYLGEGGDVRDVGELLKNTAIGAGLGAVSGGLVEGIGSGLSGNLRKSIKNDMGDISQAIENNSIRQSINNTPDEIIQRSNLARPTNNTTRTLDELDLKPIGVKPNQNAKLASATESSVNPSVLNKSSIPSQELTPVKGALQPNAVQTGTNDLASPKLLTPGAIENIKARTRELKPLSPAQEAAFNKSKLAAEKKIRREVGKTHLTKLDEKESKYKAMLGREAGLADVSDVHIGEVLEALPKGNQKLKERIANKHDALEATTSAYNELEKKIRSGFVKDGTNSNTVDLQKKRSNLERKRALLERDLMGDVRKLIGQQSLGNRTANAITNLVSFRKANMLSSLPAISRNATQDALGTLSSAIKNPSTIPTIIGSVPQSFKSAAKSSIDSWKVKPKTLSELPGYLVGNTYESLMTPVTGLANMRKAPIREALSESILRRNDLPADKQAIKNFAGMPGNEMELLVRTAMGVDNGMASMQQFERAKEAFANFSRTGSAQARAEFMDNVQKTSNLAKTLTQSLRSDGSPQGALKAALIDFALPFVSTPVNLTKTFVRQLDPRSKSVIDSILSDVRGKGRNTAASLSNALVNYGVLGSTVALASAGLINYNNGEDITKPQGISIKIGENAYIPIRALNVELPVAAAYTAWRLTHDVATGQDLRANYDKYMDMIGSSLPYGDDIVNNLKAVTGVGDAIRTPEAGGDNGYGLKSYGVNMAKSLTPFANNNMLPFVEGVQGNSLNAKKTYDKDPLQWYLNTVGKNFMTKEQYNQLDDSRDSAGRVRTVDNQGIVVHKQINDEPTAQFNNTIQGLMDFARKNGISQSVEDMWRTYDKGKNNHFTTARNSILYSDAVNGAMRKDNLLEAKPELGNLAKQFRDGFYGDNASDLLMLNGKPLNSDVSMPNKDHSKNSSKPLSVESIRNAIAQQSLSQEDRNALSEISNQKTALYNAISSRSISRDQYLTAKAELANQEAGILSKSPGYQKLSNLMSNLSNSGFFDDGGYGSTKSGQVFFWNALNNILSEKGKTPAADYTQNEQANGGYGYYRRFGRGSHGGSRVNNLPDTVKPAKIDLTGINWGNVGGRSMAIPNLEVYKPVKLGVKLGSARLKDNSQLYKQRSF